MKIKIVGSRLAALATPLRTCIGLGRGWVFHGSGVQIFMVLVYKLHIFVLMKKVHCALFVNTWLVTV